MYQTCNSSSSCELTEMISSLTSTVLLGASFGKERKFKRGTNIFRLLIGQLIEWKKVNNCHVFLVFFQDFGY